MQLTWMLTSFTTGNTGSPLPTRVNGPKMDGATAIPTYHGFQPPRYAIKTVPLGKMKTLGLVTNASHGEQLPFDLHDPGT